MKKAYQKEINEVLAHFQTDLEQGLSKDQVSKQIEKHGRNELAKAEAISPLKILLHNLNNLIVYLLIAAAALSFYMGDEIEGIAVIIALLIAVLTGFFTELRAQRSVESLQKMIFTTAKVRRNGQLEELPSAEIVPGDLLFLEEGDSIVADARLVKTSNFACIESALTGESEAVDKDAEGLYEEETALGDRLNMVFSGTAVSRGNAYAVVTQTGMQTEIGKITSLLSQSKKESTPLDKEMNRLSRILIYVAFAAGIAVVIAGALTKQPLNIILHTALILAVAAIPEAMPAVSTITLARGLKKMAEYKALVKNLPAVETLGATAVICSDKTGTLTENQMTAELITLADGTSFKVEGNGYDPKGNITLNGEVVEPAEDDTLKRLIISAVLCNNATLVEEDANYSIIGDPTEGALVVLAEKAGFGREKLHGLGWQRIAEIPFDSSQKYMATSYKNDGIHAFVKGAPDVLLRMSKQPQAEKDSLKEANHRIASEGMRVLAIAELEAYTEDGSPESMQQSLENLVVLGLVGIMDPPRSDVKEAINICQQAGIQVKMITGDHPKTASIIASEIGIKNHELSMTGRKIDELAGTDAFAENVSNTAVFARVSPENKMQIVNALREQGKIVAMTGDGVNDAPALNSADIGIAMGIRGTEVAKEAADMILTDDRFSTIVKAVREGRIIFANIKKYISFLFSCNMVEIMTVLLSIIFLMPMPILPLHILFLNLIIDIAPAMALSFEPAEKSLMQVGPRPANSGLVNKRFLTRILISGVLIGLSAFLVFNYFIGRSESLNYAQTATFSFMAFAQLFHTLNVRKESRFGLKTLFSENNILFGAMLFSFVLQLLAIYTPFLNQVLGTTALKPSTLLLILVLAAASSGVVYLGKKVFLRAKA